MKISISLLGRSTAAALTLLMLSGGLLPLVQLSSFAQETTTECFDALDNDNDGLTDYPQDDDCESIDDDYEGAGTSGLFVSITDGRETVSPNEAVTYVISLRQQRDSIRDADVRLTIAPHINFLSANEGGRMVGGIIQWDNIAVQKNVTKRLVVRAAIRPGVEDDTILIGRVVANGVTATDSTFVRHAEETPYEAPFSVSISDNRDTAQPNSLLTYHLEVRNLTGRDITEDVRVALPGGVGIEDDGNPDRRTGNNLIWLNESFDADEEKTYRFQLRVEDRLTDYTSLHTRATVRGVSASDRTVIESGIGRNALRVSVDDNRNTVEPGKELTYTVNLENDSSKPYLNGYVSAALPIYAEFISATDGGYLDGSNVRWDDVQVGPNDDRSFTYTIRVRSDAPYGHALMSSVETAGSSFRDITEVVRNSNDRVVRDPQPARRSVFFSKTASQSEALPGTTVRYTLRVQNVTLYPMSGTEIRDRFDPSVLSLVDAGGALILDNGQLQWNLPILQPGEEWQRTYSLRVSNDVAPGLSLSNIATISGPDIATITLDERIAVVHTGVVTHLPETGAPLGAIMMLLLSPVPLTMAFGHRRLVG